MTRDELLAYDEKQKHQVDKVAAKIKADGKISTASDFYPDIQIGNSVGFTRGAVPLKAMMLLYETVVVRIHPYSKEQLERYVGMPYNEFLSAIKQKCIIPIIDNVLLYKDEYFQTLLQTNPPSLLSRGIALLNHADIGDVLEDGKKIIYDSKISSDISIQNEYKKRRATLKYQGALDKAIESDLAIQYADLRLFGYNECIEEIFSAENPRDIYANLKQCNEILTYPILFGMGGVANFSDKKALENSFNLPVDFCNVSQPSKEKCIILSSNLEQLWAFFGIIAENLSVNEIIAFQRKGGCARLRKALESLKSEIEKTSIENEGLHIEVIENVEDAVVELYTNLNPSIMLEIEKKQKLLKHGLSGISLGIGGLLALVGGIIPGVVSFFVSEGIKKLTGNSFVDMITKMVLSKKISPAVSSIWQASKILKEVK